jgi:hydroxymethylbilane synthase
MRAIPPPSRLVIASRESRLALWQAHHVEGLLEKLYSQCDVVIDAMTTRGDPRQLLAQGADRLIKVA